MKNTRKLFLLLAYLVFSYFSLSSQVSLILPSKTVEQDQIFDAEIKVASFNSIVGAQFTIEWDSLLLDFKRFNGFYLPDLTANSFGAISPGKLTFSWIDNSLQGISKVDNTTIFSLQFEAIGTPVTSSPLIFSDNPTTREISDTSYNEIAAQFYDGIITIDETISSSFNSAPDKISVKEAFPNPFTDFTNVNFNLIKEEEVTISVFDISGKKILYKKTKYGSGPNILTFEKNIFPESGTYMLQMRSKSFIVNQKLIVL